MGLGIGHLIYKSPVREVFHVPEESEAALSAMVAAGIRTQQQQGQQSNDEDGDEDDEPLDDDDEERERRTFEDVFDDNFIDLVEELQL